mmetsp:Transcript_17097/g.51123  ORF Transcript_17097/g.51123 Transcript_17097/m.51123 type:complete len:185 (-) Transcript_17097:88-642(-)
METKTALVPIADGSEELEAIAIIDTLRRASVVVTVAAVGASTQVTCARQTKLVADKRLDDCSTEVYDLIVLPGGMPGATHLHECETLLTMLRAQRDAERLYGAICASPAVVLHAGGLLAGKRATCYPSFADKLEQHVNEAVVVDGQVITSQGPGTAIQFALACVRLLCGEAVAARVAKGMLVLP